MGFKYHSTVAIICTFLIHKQIKALLFRMFQLSIESLLVTYCKNQMSQNKEILSSIHKSTTDI